MNLLMRCFVYNPKERISAVQGMSHPYCASFNEGSDNSSTGKVAIGRNDNTKATTAVYRDLLRNVSMSFADGRVRIPPASVEVVPHTFPEAPAAAPNEPIGSAEHKVDDGKGDGGKNDGDADAGGNDGNDHGDSGDGA